jgi:HEAT repeat protein
MKTTTRRFALSCLFACLFVLGACGGTPLAFSTKYADNDQGDIQSLLQRVQNAPPRAPSTIAVGVTEAPAQLYAFDVAEQRVLWKKPIAATSAPMLAGESVIFQTASSVVAVSLRTGEKQVEVSRGNKLLRGVDGEGALAVFVMSEGMGTYAESEVVLLRRGAIDWTRPIEGMVGVPAIAGTVVLVPWSNQYVTAVDIESGREIARLRVRDGVLAHALRDREHTYVGSQHGVARLSASIGSGKIVGPGYFKLPEQNLPGRPLLLRDVYAETTPPTPDSAQHRIALVWEPRALDAERTGLEDDTVYLVFYRFVFALSPTDYGVRWVYRSESDLVGAAAQPGGVLIGDAAGWVVGIAASSGEVVSRANTGLASTVLRLPMGGRPTEAGAPLGVDARRASLLAAAQDTDARMVPARILSVRALAKLDEAEATASLIALCEDRSLAPAVRTEACVALKSRSLGTEHLLTALGRHAQFLSNTSAPPVGALAKAAVGSKEPRAVGPLTEHLHDPNTLSSDLVAVVNALHDLGDPSAAKPLEAFLLRYHADPVDPDVVTALERVPATLHKLEGQAAVPALEIVQKDGLSVYSVRQKATEVLGALKAEAEAEAAAKAAAEAAKDQKPEEAPAAAVTPVQGDEAMPTHLTTELLEQALLPVRDQLQSCVADAGKFQARAVLVIEDGKVLMVSVLPADLQNCVEPLIRAQTFARTRLPKKERVTHIIKR